MQLARPRLRLELRCPHSEATSNDLARIARIDCLLGRSRRFPGWRRVLRLETHLSPSPHFHPPKHYPRCELLYAMSLRHPQSSADKTTAGRAYSTRLLLRSSQYTYLPVLLVASARFRSRSLHY